MRFFNTTMGPLALTLTSGKSVLAMSQSWVDIPNHEAGSSSIADYLMKGYLKKALFEIGFDEKPTVASVKPTVLKDIGSVDSE